MNAVMTVLAAGSRVKPARHAHYYHACYGSCPPAHLSWWGWLLVIGLIVAAVVIGAALKGR